MIRLLVVACLVLPLTPAVSADDNRSATELNVSVTLFDPGIPEDRSVHRDQQIFPRVRKIEALYLPFVLRNNLASRQEWGAVRIVPTSDVAAELLVYGTIIRSDGDELELHIRAVDASGRIWLDQNFAGSTADQDIYNDIATSLRAVRDNLDNKALRDVIEISLLRYAQQLAPAAFDAFLENNADNTFTIKRLPASNDPMVQRIERLRGVEYVFTDAVDAKFSELSADVATVYDLWREYRRKFNQYQLDDTQRVQNSTSDARRGSFEAMLNRYENYKWDRQAEQEQESWAIGFENEMGPTITAIETRVAELEGWVEDRYAEWQRILGELFEVETAMPE